MPAIDKLMMNLKKLNKGQQLAKEKLISFREFKLKIKNKTEFSEDRKDKFKSKPEEAKIKILHLSWEKWDWLVEKLSVKWNLKQLKKEKFFSKKFSNLDEFKVN